MAQLIDTKLRPPPLRDERVYRPHLYEHLAHFESGVVVVSAPPGFGKSTIVVEWLTSQERPFAWYSLDRYDGDVGLFAEYLASAVGELTARESGLLSMIGGHTPDPREMIATLIGDLDDAPQRSALVLDDYHEVESQAVHEVVNYLVDNLPDGFVLVIVSRSDPPLPLGRLRTRDHLREIRGTDLRFTSAQVAEYFEQTSGLDLDAEQIAVVAERSEGWVSALQLVNLGMDRTDPSSLTSTLSAHHPYIAGYLVDEVLERLRPELARFLLETSPFERFDARLCRDVTGIADAADLIAEIERENAFLIPLGADAWYRYHHLFAELLRSRLRRSDPDLYDDLLIRAARACEKRGLIDDAVDYALKAGDVALAGEIVDDAMGVALGSGAVARLRAWLRLFPVPSDPAAHIVALGWAWCRIFEGSLESATELIDRIEAEHLDEFERSPVGQLDVMRAIVAFQAGDVVAVESHARRGLGRLAQPSLYLESLAHLYVGRALHAQAMREEARPHFERAASLAERGNTLAAVSALFWLGVVDMDLGNLVDAERSMKRAREVGARSAGPSGEPHPAAGVGDVGLAYIRLNQLEADDAIRLAERGCRLLQRSTFVEMVFRALFVWAEALSIAGRFEEAERVAAEGIEWLAGRRIAEGPLETWLMLAQARNSWRRGRLDESEDGLEEVRRRGLGSPQSDEALGFYEAADVASLALRRGDAEAAGPLVAALPEDPGGNVMFTIKTRVLTAALHEIQGDRRAAVVMLEAALDLAQLGYRFQFSFVGPVIRPALERMVGRSRHDEFVRSILERLPAEGDQVARQPIDPLTDRELEVLAEIAAGYSNDEIADRLFISRGTVKRHASNIYLKLGAHHRAEAAARGRELGLVD